MSTNAGSYPHQWTLFPPVQKSGIRKLSYYVNRIYIYIKKKRKKVYMDKLIVNHKSTVFFFKSGICQFMHSNAAYNMLQKCPGNLLKKFPCIASSEPCEFLKYDKSLQNTL